MSPERERVRLIVHGRVQGVFFRQTTVAQARMLGLDGWVRNRADDTVEILAEGPRASLEALEAWSAEGPPLAHVSHVDATWGPAEPVVQGGFHVFRSA